MEWKSGEEERTSSRFVNYTGHQIRNDGSVRKYYMCHRSGVYKKRGRSLRHMKVQGTNKIGGKCPASMKILIHDTGECLVFFHGDKEA